MRKINFNKLFGLRSYFSLIGKGKLRLFLFMLCQAGSSYTAQIMARVDLELLIFLRSNTRAKIRGGRHHARLSSVGDQTKGFVHARHALE